VMDLLTRSSAAIAIIGALILILGCIVAFVNLSLLAIKGLPINAPVAYAVGDPTRSLTLNLVRSQLGHIIVFTLEVLVAADVIETLTVPVHAQSFETLGKIAIIVAVRTCLSFFLEKELEVVDEELRHEKPVEFSNSTPTPPSQPEAASYPLLNVAGEGTQALHAAALSAWYEQPPSLMMLVTCALLAFSLTIFVASRFKRPAPVAELAALTMFFCWCYSNGNCLIVFGVLGALVVAAVCVNFQSILQVAGSVFDACLTVIIPKPHWSLHALLFWAAACSVFAWVISVVAVQSGVQAGCERLWLALLVVVFTFYAVNSFPILKMPASPHDGGGDESPSGARSPSARSPKMMTRTPSSSSMQMTRSPSSSSMHRTSSSKCFQMEARTKDQKQK